MGKNEFYFVVTNEESDLFIAEKEETDTLVTEFFEQAKKFNSQYDAEEYITLISRELEVVKRYTEYNLADYDVNDVREVESLTVVLQITRR